MANGVKHPKLIEGLVLRTKDGKDLKVISVMPGAHGIVQYKERAGRTGRFGRLQEIKRSSFWKDIEDTPAP